MESIVFSELIENLTIGEQAFFFCAKLTAQITMLYCDSIGFQAFTGASITGISMLFCPYIGKETFSYTKIKTCSNILSSINEADAFSNNYNLIGHVIVDIDYIESFTFALNPNIEVLNLTIKGENAYIPTGMEFCNYHMKQMSITGSVTSIED